jgi:putative ABC transport system permease protein
MLRSYLTLAVRTLRRHLGYTAVNVIGLTVGLACCAVVAVFLQYELSYDTHHEDADRTYRILRDYRSSTYSTLPFQGYYDADASMQRVLPQRLTEAVPAIEQAANFEILGNNPTYVRTPGGDEFESDRQLLTTTGPAFADLFTFERLAGAPLEEALAQPYSAVLTRSSAERYFGDQNPIGQTLEIDSLTTTVRAVVADPPANSRITFDLALQVERIPNWGAYCYLRLAEGTAPDAVEPQITEVMDAVYPWRLEDETRRNNLKGERLQALTDIHLADRALYDDTPHRNPTYLWAFGAIGLLILVITTINYANLALALYAGRNAEIGVRKAVGGYRGQIAGQFLTEAGLLAVACVPLALALCAAVLPAFNALMGTSLAAARLLQPPVLLTMAGLAVLAGLAAGAYPAFVLARKQTVDLFDRGLSSGGGSGRGWTLRHGLIGLQFAVLIGLGSLSWIAYDQLRYMQREGLGFETERVVRLRTFQADSSEYAHLRERLTASAAVQAVGAGVTPNPGGNRNNVQAAGSDVVQRDVYTQNVDAGWFAAMGITHPVIDSMRQAGPSAPERVLINEAAAARFGFDPAAGEEIIIGPNYDDPIRLTVDGVLPNIHLRPMRQEIKPTVFQVQPVQNGASGPIVRLAAGRTEAGLEHVRTVWSDLKPGTPQRTTFLSAQVAALYEQEQRFGVLAAALSGLAILMAAIGLASLVAYLTRLRLKEIGVRKALGGSTRSIVALLNKEYVQIVGAAFLVGAPLAWWAARAWLGQFAYQVEISPLTFVAAGLGALLVAVAAVSTQAVRAARVDPATVLRSE